MDAQLAVGSSKSRYKKLGERLCCSATKSGLTSTMLNTFFPVRRRRNKKLRS